MPYYSTKVHTDPEVQVNLTLKDALKFLNKYATGRGLYACCNVHLPSIEKEETHVFPGYTHIKLTQAQAREHIQRLLKGFEDRAYIRMHRMGSCIFIGQ